MANKVEIKLNSEGVRSLLKSAEMLSICQEHARAIQSRCGSGYEMDTYTGKNRVNAMVWAETDKAKRDNIKNNTLLKAVR